ncbi:MAG: hypothetical protein ACN4GZ_02520 [Acidimicrobiales bacterium]
MASIHNQILDVSPVEGHPGQRTVRVEYDIVAHPGDAMVGAEIYERVRVHGVDLRDAPVPANSRPLVIHQESFIVEKGERHRVVETTVHRSSLDVEQDWWNTGQGGETQPLAEWVDHLVAEIQLSDGLVEIDQASTPVVTGSWGALGPD